MVGRMLKAVVGTLVAALAWVAGLAIALSLAAAAALWWWSGSPQSLAQALAWAGDALADGATGERPLHASGVQGSLREGGQIEQLRWSRDGLTVDVQGLTVQWPSGTWLAALLQRQLALQTLHARRLQVTDRRPPQPPEPWAPPPPLVLPWLRELVVPLALDEAVWLQDQALTLRQLEATYRYGPGPSASDGPRHGLTVTQLEWLDGRYSAEASLEAEGDMALDLRLTGTLTARVPDGTRAHPLQLQASLSGPIGPTDAQLRLEAKIASTERRPGPAPALTAQAELRPWSALPVTQADLAFSQLDLGLFWPTAPRTGLSGTWQMRSDRAEPPTGGDPWQSLAQHRWRLTGQLSNTLPGPWDRQRLPLGRLSASLRVEPGRWQLDALDAIVAGGQVQASGHALVRDGRPSAWAGEVRLRGVQPAQALSTVLMQPLDGTLSAQTNNVREGGTAFELQLAPSTAAGGGRARWPAPRLAATGEWQPGRLRLEQALLQIWQAQLQAQGQWSQAEQRLSGEARLTAPGLSAQAQGQGPLREAAVLRGWQSTAQIRLSDVAALQQWSLQTLADIERAFPEANTLAALPPIWRDARWQGQASLDARLNQDHWDWRQSGKLDWAAEGVQWRTEHGLQAAGRWMPTGWQARLETLELQLRNDRDPLGLVLALQGATELTASAQDGVRLGAGTLAATPTLPGQRRPTTWSTDPLRLEWQHITWRQGVLGTQGRLRGLALSWVNAWMSNTGAPQGPLVQAGLQGDMTFDGAWDVDLPLAPPPAGANLSASPARAEVSLQRRSGDLSVLVGEGPRAERLPAGLQDVSLHLELQGTALDARLRWQSENAGQALAEGSTQLLAPSPTQAMWGWADAAPVRGRLQADLPQVGLWSRLAPPGWRVSGQLRADATVTGTRSEPAWSGQLQVRQLSVRSLPDGLDFSDGELRASLSGQTLTIEQFRIRGAGGAAGGVLSGQGSARWNTVTVNGQRRLEPLIDLQLRAQQLRLLARADRRLTLTGALTAQLQGQRLDLTGRLDADQALLLLPDESTPALGSDVVVRGTERPPGFGAGSPVQAHINVDLGLGQNFQVRGLGLDTYLTGQLSLTLSPNQSGPQITGQVQTVRGTYRAYGQALGIEQGVVRFNGPPDNPALDILALRPHPTQRVGVQIGGVAQNPRVRLYADPDMPDSEKLAWLVLGRPATGAGAEAAVLQQAALALFSGAGNDRSLTRTLGLDELSFQGRSTGADGSTTAAGLTLGKRISNQLYVTYSRSITAAVGTVAVFYDLSRFVTLRAQAGDDNAIDLLFTYSFDGRGAATQPRTIGGASSP